MVAEILTGPVPLDLKPDLVVCNCEFAPYHYSAEESWHYLRQCLFCGHQWYGLHCPHDGYQNPCSQCGGRPEVIHEVPSVG